MTLLAYADGADSPRTSPFAIADDLGLDDPEVLLGWIPEPRAWLADDRLRGATYMAGYQLVDAVAAGRLRYLPIRLSSMPRHVAHLRPAVGVVTGIPRGDGYAFGSTAGWGPALARSAERLVVEVDDEGPDLGGPMIEGNVVRTVPRPPADGPISWPRPPRDADLAVARNVVAILPDEPTIQVGPGGIAEAVIASVDRPLDVWAGLVTDAMAGLHGRGFLRAPLRAAYAWGGEPVVDLHRAGMLELLPLERSHDLTALAAERFVAVNTALQIGLDGACNVETVRGRAIAGIGGNADFAAAAARATGGLSVMALCSTTPGGRSAIVPAVEHVSTPRCDVDVVVTEQGVADLRGLDDAGRAERIAAVAHPDHRDALRAGTGG